MTLGRVCAYLNAARAALHYRSVIRRTGLGVSSCGEQSAQFARLHLAANGGRCGDARSCRLDDRRSPTRGPRLTAAHAAASPQPEAPRSHARHRRPDHRWRRGIRRSGSDPPDHEHPHHEAPHTEARGRQARASQAGASQAGASQARAGQAQGHRIQGLQVAPAGSARRQPTRTAHAPPRPSERVRRARNRRPGRGRARRDRAHGRRPGDPWSGGAPSAAVAPGPIPRESGVSYTLPAPSQPSDRPSAGDRRGNHLRAARFAGANRPLLRP
jgi:hypothetical protein